MIKREKNELKSKKRSAECHYHTKKGEEKNNNNTELSAVAPDLLYMYVPLLFLSFSFLLTTTYLVCFSS